MTDKPNPVGLKKEISGHPTDHSRKASITTICVHAFEWLKREKLESYENGITHTGYMDLTLRCSECGARFEGRLVQQ